jgi:hypothetical protein
VKQRPHSPIESIPPAYAVRASLCATLHQVQLLRSLLRLAERKERQQGRPRQVKETSRA